MKLQITESVQNLTLYLVQVSCYFLKFFKVCRMFEKVVEHRSRVPPLAKTSVATSFQSSDGWMFAKTVSGPLERVEVSVITRESSFKRLYIYKQGSNTRLLNRLKIRKLYLMFWHQHPL